VVIPAARGLHSSKLQLNVSTFRPMCWGAVLESVTKRTRVEQRCGRVYALACSHSAAASAAATAAAAMAAAGAEAARDSLFSVSVNGGSCSAEC